MIPRLEPLDYSRRRQSFSERIHLDLPLLVALLAISLLGMLILYSASGQDLGHLARQGTRLGLAFVLMFAVAQVPPTHLARWSPWLFGAGLLLLLVVLEIGHIGKGAQRWLDLGFIRFQPSELMKIAVPMMLAWFFAETPLPPRFGRLLFALALVGTPAVLVALQPDLGTAVLITSAGSFVILLTGISARLIAGVVAAGVACAPLLWFSMHDYQRQRVLTFLDPETDPLGSGYHIIQSKIAIGSGGVYGKGWFNGTQSQLDFIPERSTDFIFAVFAEEFGLVGGLVLLAVYLAIIARGLYIALQAQDTYTRLLGGSLALTFFIYVFVNMGMVSGLLPVVGVPLPLISYGGTSMVTLMIGFGILMSIHTHRKLLPA